MTSLKPMWHSANEANIHSFVCRRLEKHEWVKSFMCVTRKKKTKKNLLLKKKRKKIQLHSHSSWLCGTAVTRPRWAPQPDEVMQNLVSVRRAFNKSLLLHAWPVFPPRACSSMNNSRGQPLAGRVRRQQTARWDPCVWGVWFAGTALTSKEVTAGET